MHDIPTIIRFPQGGFNELQSRLLQDSSREAFALLSGKRTTKDGYSVIKVTDAYHPSPDDYDEQSISSLRLKRAFIYDKLVKLQQSGCGDTLIDVHTHPFCNDSVAFSAVDDHDEDTFHRWLTATLDGFHYASIVLSQTDYAARTWEIDGENSVYCTARIKTQTAGESWPCAEIKCYQDVAMESFKIQSGFLARSALALGLDTMRKVMNDQTIGIIGVGGLGSVIAENLIHSGFHAIHLIDPDRVEVTNLNRIVGAYYCDAATNRLKVEVVQEHLQRINPDAMVYAHAIGVEEEAALPVLMQCDWLIVATDNHFSRYQAQNIAIQLGAPLISAGVNITVEGQNITDMSGEVITARNGDGLCLNCLGRINPTAVAAHENRGEFIGDELVRRGYVSGREVKEPAVKTLNAILGAMTVEVLLNQYTHRQPHEPICVYENNQRPTLYADTESVSSRFKNCLFCS